MNVGVEKLFESNQRGSFAAQLLKHCRLKALELEILCKMLSHEPPKSSARFNYVSNVGIADIAAVLWESGNGSLSSEFGKHKPSGSRG